MFLNFSSKCRFLKPQGRYMLIPLLKYTIDFPFFSSCFPASIAAQEIFKLLPHTFVDPIRLPELFEKV